MIVICFILILSISIGQNRGTSLSEKIKLRSNKIEETIKRNVFQGKKEWKKYFPSLFRTTKESTESNINVDLVLRSRAESEKFYKKKVKQQNGAQTLKSDEILLVVADNKPDNKAFDDPIDARVNNNKKLILKKLIDTQNIIMEKLDLILREEVDKSRKYTDVDMAKLEGMFV